MKIDQTPVSVDDIFKNKGRSYIQKAAVNKSLKLISLFIK